MKKYLFILVAMMSMSFAQEAGDRSLSFSFGFDPATGTGGINIEDIDTAPFNVSYGKFLSDSFMLSGGLSGSLDEIGEAINLGLDYHFMDLGSGSLFALLNVQKEKDMDATSALGVGYLIPLGLSEKMFLNIELSTDTEDLAGDFFIGGGLTWIF